MKSFTQHNADPFFQFTAVQFFICFAIAAVAGVALTLALDWRFGLGAGLGVFAIQYFILGELTMYILVFGIPFAITILTTEFCKLKCYVSDE